MRITELEAVAEHGKYIHRKGSDAYFTRCTLLARETAESFEEVDSIPPQKPDFDYDNEVNALIREQYSESQEFAILRQKDEKPEEYKAYYQYCEECKAKVKSRMM